MQSLNKRELLDLLIKKFELELDVAVQAVKIAHEDATNEESKPENQYDTRALEASYVARGQALRVAELNETLFECKNLILRDFSEEDSIAATALIEIESNNKKSLLFFLPKGGGSTIEMNQSRIQVVTPSTPLGKALLQMKKGDFISVELASSQRDYEIIDIQ